jgi:hypothetical protein
VYEAISQGISQVIPCQIKPMVAAEFLFYPNLISLQATATKVKVQNTVCPIKQPF